MTTHRQTQAHTNARGNRARAGDVWHFFLPKKIYLSCVSVSVCVSLCVAFVFAFSQAVYAQGSMEFYRELARRPVATVGDAVHAVARFKGYTGQTNLYEELTFLDRFHGIRFHRRITRYEEMELTKGNASHMLMSAMGIKGWVMQRIFKGSQRYALREAVYLKLLPAESTMYQKMSGNELLGFLSRMIEMTEGQER